MEKQFIENSADKYQKMVKIARDIRIDNARIRDEQMILTTLEILLVTEAVNGNASFNVERKAFLPANLTGQEFEIESVRFSPRDSMAGGKYVIHLYALSPNNRYYYEFVGEIRELSPNLVVDDAAIDEVPSDGLDVNLD